MSTRIVAIITAVVMLEAAAVVAQAPKAGPEQKRLEYFVGKWTSEAEMKASPIGPGGQVSMNDTCEWFAGGFHVVCRSDGKGPMGEMKGLGILGYNAEEKSYTYYGIDNSGMGELSRGSVQGKAWNWIGESKMGGKLMKSRYTLTETSPTSYTFKWEMSADGGPWSTVMEGKTTRVKTS